MHFVLTIWSQSFHGDNRMLKHIRVQPYMLPIGQPSFSKAILTTIVLDSLHLETLTPGDLILSEQAWMWLNACILCEQCYPAESQWFLFTSTPGLPFSPGLPLTFLSTNRLNRMFNSSSLFFVDLLKYFFPC